MLLRVIDPVEWYMACGRLTHEVRRPERRLRPGGAAECRQGASDSDNGRQTAADPTGTMAVPIEVRALLKRHEDQRTMSP